jgi:hypothetical protein
MAHHTAGTAGTTKRTYRRKWRNSRPPAARLDVSPDERAAAEVEKARKQLSVLLSVRFTKAEKETIERRAKKLGIRLSDFVRIVLLSDLKEPAPPAHDPAVIRELAWQLSKIGTNLNQMALVANKERILPRIAEFEAASAQIAGAIERVLAL